MKKTILAIVVCLSVWVPAVALGATELGSGHITVGGPWISVRSLTVVTDHNNLDGFFLPVGSSLWGKHLSAHAASNGSGLPYALSMNFHGSTPGPLGRNFLGNCSGIAVDEDLNFHPAAEINSCKVPNLAVTVEVTAFYGADLDVVVDILDP